MYLNTDFLIKFFIKLIWGKGFVQLKLLYNAAPLMSYSTFLLVILSQNSFYNFEYFRLYFKRKGSKRLFFLLNRCRYYDLLDFLGDLASSMLFSKILDLFKGKIFQKFPNFFKNLNKI